MPLRRAGIIIVFLQTQPNMCSVSLNVVILYLAHHFPPSTGPHCARTPHTPHAHRTHAHTEVEKALSRAM